MKWGESLARVSSSGELETNGAYAIGTKKYYSFRFKKGILVLFFLVLGVVLRNGDSS